MDKAIFERFLQERFQPALDYYIEKAESYRRAYVHMEWSIIILSGLNAFLVGSQTIFDWPIVRLFALLVSVAISVLAGAFKAFDYQGKWTTYNQLVTDLRDEDLMHMAEGGDYAQVDDKDSLFITKVSFIMKRVSSNVPNTTQPLPNKKPVPQANP